MGLREEIEKLYIKPFWNNYTETHRQFLEKSDVLSVLDEHLGECLDDFVCKKNKPMVFIDAKPGDRIIIYKIAREEDE